MISINATLVLQVIHFLVLAFILNKLLFKPVLKIIDERKQHLEKTKAEIDNIKEKTIQLEKAFRSTENEARKGFTKERVQQNREGMSETESLLDHSQKEADSIKKEADKKAEKEIEQSRPLLEGEAAILAKGIIEKMIGGGPEVGSEML
jgi:F-type H+-transporting ATPase subunit b